MKLTSALDTALAQARFSLLILARKGRAKPPLTRRTRLQLIARRSADSKSGLGVLILITDDDHGDPGAKVELSSAS